MLINPTILEICAEIVFQGRQNGASDVNGSQVVKSLRSKCPEHRLSPGGLTVLMICKTWMIAHPYTIRIQNLPFIFESLGRSIPITIFGTSIYMNSFQHLFPSMFVLNRALIRGTIRFLRVGTVKTAGNSTFRSFCGIGGARVRSARYPFLCKIPTPAALTYHCKTVEITKCTLQFRTRPTPRASADECYFTSLQHMSFYSQNYRRHLA